MAQPEHSWVLQIFFFFFWENLIVAFSFSKIPGKHHSSGSLIYWRWLSPLCLEEIALKSSFAVSEAGTGLMEQMWWWGWNPALKPGSSWKCSFPLTLSAVRVSWCDTRRFLPDGFQGVKRGQVYILILVLHDGRCLRAHHTNFRTLQDCAYFAGIVQWVAGESATKAKIWGRVKPTTHTFSLHSLSVTTCMTSLTLFLPV